MEVAVIVGLVVEAVGTAPIHALVTDGCDQYGPIIPNSAVALTLTSPILEFSSLLEALHAKGNGSVGHA